MIPRLTPWWLLGVLALGGCATNTSDSTPPGAIGFEQDPVGTLPIGWRDLGGGGAYVVNVHGGAAHSGRRGLRVSAKQARFAWQGAAVRRVDATPYRGRVVRLSCWARFEGDTRGSYCGMTLTVERAGGVPTDLSRLQGHGIRSDEWRPYAVRVNVPADADTLQVSLMLHYTGRADFDDVVIESLGPAGVGDLPPLALDPRREANLVAFARLCGIVRHFHPSDEAARADWDSLTIASVAEVESARTPAELVTALRRTFAPVAPTVSLATEAVAAVERAALIPEGTEPGLMRGWRHQGFGAGLMGFPYPFVTERLEVPIESTGDGVLPLGTCWTRGLGGGVWASVPLTLASGVNGTLPPPSASHGAAVPGRPDDWVPSARDRSTRFAVIILAWNVLRHFYPYFDVVATDWDAALVDALRSAATDRDAAELRGTLGRMISRLDDGHGGVMGPGVGNKILPVALEFAGEDLVVLAAEDRSGPRLGDVVTAVDGRPIAKLVREERQLVCASTEGLARFRIATRLTQSDTARVFTLRSPDGATRTVRLKPVSGSRPTPAKPDSISQLRPGLWYVDLDRITDDDWKRELPRLAQARGLVFDLRGYPRRVSTVVLAHLAEKPLQSAKWNIPVLCRPTFEGVVWNQSGWPVPPAQPHLGAPAVFLIDGRAVSYAETYMGIVEAFHLATIVGEPTAGTNGNVARAQLPAGYAFTFTGMKVLKHDGSRHHGVGIHPTVPVSRTAAGIAAGRDEMLERAIQVVGGMHRASRHFTVRLRVGRPHQSHPCTPDFRRGGSLTSDSLGGLRSAR